MLVLAGSGESGASQPGSVSSPGRGSGSVWCGLSAAAGQIISSEIARYNQHQVWVLIMSSAD